MKRGKRTQFGICSYALYWGEWIGLGHEGAVSMLKTQRLHQSQAHTVVCPARLLPHAELCHLETVAMNTDHHCRQISEVPSLGLQPFVGLSKANFGAASGDSLWPLRDPFQAHLKKGSAPALAFHYQQEHMEPQ